MSSPLESDPFSCSDLVEGFDPFGLEVFLTGIQEVNSGFFFSLMSFRMTCVQGMRSFVLIWMFSVSLLNLGLFLYKA